MADPPVLTTPVTEASFDAYPWPPEVLDMVFVSILTGSPFANKITNLPTSSGKVVFPVAAPAGGAWTSEMSPIPETDLNDDSYVISVCKLATIVGLSNESLEDASVPISGLVTQAITDALGPVMDNGLLYGAAPPAPDGVVAHATAAAAGADFREAVITAAGELGDAGANPARIVAFAAPSIVNAEWARTGEGSGLPIHADAPAGALTIGPGIGVVAVPSLTGGDVLVADTSSLFLVVRDQLSMELNQSVYFAHDATALRVRARVAVAAPTPTKSLRKATITPAGA